MLLYNLARAEQELGEHCAAVDRFQRYLGVAGADAAEQKRIEKANAGLSAARTACKAVLEPVLPAPAPGVGRDLTPAPVGAGARRAAARRRPRAVALGGRRRARSPRSAPVWL